MDALKFIMWLLLFAAFYIFFGYGLFLSVYLLFKRSSTGVSHTSLPTVTLLIPCYNEADVLPAKIINCGELDYPADKLRILFITDGSSDGSETILAQHERVQSLHAPERRGKTAALNRAMPFVQTSVVVFSDANSFLNTSAIRQLVRHFADPVTGCVSGEKRIVSSPVDNASAAGEGLYWRYESILKKLDSDFHSAVGAVGELVALRTELYSDLPDSIILDDFVQSMQIAAAGYRIVYEPKAVAIESASLNTKEELKRKLRIAAGCWQAMARLRSVLSFARTPALYFQYFSRRILRWCVAPFLLVALFAVDAMIAFAEAGFFRQLFYLQLVFYLFAAAGYLARERKTRFKFVFAPYYFCLMHYAVLAGMYRYRSGQQNAAWEKARRQ